jgi:hypothetical protein
MGIMIRIRRILEAVLKMDRKFENYGVFLKMGV